MKKWMILLGVSLLLLAAKPSQAPPLLPDGAIVEERAIFCPGEIITVRGYNLYGSDAWIEARTYSIDRDGRLVVILYLAFPHADAESSPSRIILIPEGEVPREVTFDELIRDYPTVCSLVKPRA